jgi:hypothetical protein
MQSSRTHAKGKGKAIEPEDETSSSDEQSDEEDSESDSDSGDAEIEEANRVFAIDHCRHLGAEYAFQMAYAQVERYSIRISTASPAHPTCSCAEPNTCRHILYLLEQLQQLADDQADANEVAPLSAYEQISTRGLDEVCEDLHWEFREGPDLDVTRWQLKKDHSWRKVTRHTKSLIKERMRIVRDIMATMSPVSTDDFRADIFDTSERLTHSIYTMGDLEATVSKLLILDDRIFEQFQYFAPRDVRASDYFNKMASKAREACKLLDNFCNVGGTVGNQHDVIWCADALVNIVAAISVNVAQRQPLSPSSREAAARALVSILGMVVRDRNHDAYYNPSLPRRRPHGEPQRDRNLYLRLIGDPRSSSASGYFVIKALQDLPEALLFVDELEDILTRLKSVGWAAPPSYLEKLKALILQLKSGSANPSPPSTASGKRPATTLDRKENKRMK